MIQPVTPLLLALALPFVWTASAPARAGAPLPPPPACASPDVVEHVALRLRARNAYAEVDPRTVSEAPTVVGNVVRCGICVRVFVYDAPRTGMIPTVRCEAHGYIVRARPNGFVVLSVE